MKVEENVSIASLTTFKVGGVVRYLVTLETDGDAALAVQFATDKKVPLIPLGGGSNMLGRDGVHEAVFVRVGMDSTSASVEGGTVRLSVDAGATWDAVVAYTVEHGWWGIENLTSIPGTTGGAVVQNIGAYGAVLSDVVLCVDAYDIQRMQPVRVTKDQCAFGYRTSIFKQEQDRFIILRVDMELTTRRDARLSYKDLAEHFAGGGEPTLGDIRSAVAEIRARKFPPLDTYGTAGSFFLNPVMSAEDAARVTAQYPLMPLFPLPEGGVKVPIAWFLEHVIKIKGARDGLVHVWREHALVIAADSGATSNEVRVFAEKIIARVQNELGVKISFEVRVL